MILGSARLGSLDAQPGAGPLSERLGRLIRIVGARVASISLAGAYVSMIAAVGAHVPVVAVVGEANGDGD